MLRDDAIAAAKSIAAQHGVDMVVIVEPDEHEPASPDYGYCAVGNARMMFPGGVIVARI